MLQDHLNTALLFESGELSPSETAEFASHLASCKECQALVGAAGKAHAWAEVAAEDPPPELVAKVLALHGPAPAARSGHGWLKGTVLTGAACLVVFLAVRKPEQPASDADLSVKVWEMEQRRVEFQKELRALKASPPKARGALR